MSENVRSGVSVIVADERRDDRRIQAAAQVGANRHVGAQLQPYRVDQETAQFFRVFRLGTPGLGDGFGERPVPVTLLPGHTVGDDHDVAGR